jgi:hypothetical protein
MIMTAEKQKSICNEKNTKLVQEFNMFVKNLHLGIVYNPSIGKTEAARFQEALSQKNNKEQGGGAGLSFQLLGRQSRIVVQGQPRQS